jgi:hypothetical protein
MVETCHRVHFEAAAILRKRPSIKNDRARAAGGSRLYLMIDSTLDDCIDNSWQSP